MSYKGVIATDPWRVWSEQEKKKANKVDPLTADDTEWEAVKKWFDAPGQVEKIQKSIDSIDADVKKLRETYDLEQKQLATELENSNANNKPPAIVPAHALDQKPIDTNPSCLDIFIPKTYRK